MIARAPTGRWGILGGGTGDFGVPRKHTHVDESTNPSRDAVSQETSWNTGSSNEFTERARARQARTPRKAHARTAWTAAVSETSRSVHKGYGYIGYPSAWRQRSRSVYAALRPAQGRPLHASRRLTHPQTSCTLRLVPVGHSRGPVAVSHFKKCEHRLGGRAHRFRRAR